MSELIEPRITLPLESVQKFLSLRCAIVAERRREKEEKKKQKDYIVFGWRLAWHIENSTNLHAQEALIAKAKNKSATILLTAPAITFSETAIKCSFAAFAASQQDGATIVRRRDPCMANKTI